MNDSSPPSIPVSSDQSLAKNLLSKLVVIIGCIVILQIPLYFVESKREERAARQSEVVEDITHAWGGSRQVHGPVMVVPVKLKADPTTARFVFIAPSRLQISGEINSDYLKRGIYRAQVYEANLSMEGVIQLPPEAGSPDYEVDWARGRLVFALGSTKGVSVTKPLFWDGQEKSLSNVASANLGVEGLGGFVEVQEGQSEYRFSLGVAMKGSQSLDFSLLAADARVSIDSKSTDPSFRGTVLPDSRGINEDGFNAIWTLGALERAIPTVWLDTKLSTVLLTARAESGFGVALLSGITDYRSIERALKYGILFLLTVFAGCFLGEFLGGRSLHVLNYLLVGAALCLFFLALLALAEIWGFVAAYIFAGLASTGMIVAYAKAVMKGTRAVSALGLMLGGIFSYLFLVLRMEDLSLIAGTILLFVLLAAVMFATRHLQFDDTIGSRRFSG